MVFTGLIVWSCSEDSSTEPENKTPTCSITSPLQNTVFTEGDTFNINVDADDEDGTIAEVRFYIDNIGIGSDSDFPYTCEYSTPVLCSGNHFLKIRAKDNEGEEHTDSIAFGIQPKFPTELTCSSINEKTISLNWVDNSYSEQGFEIDRKVGVSDSWVIGIASIDANETSWTDTGLTTGTTYYYRVRAFYSTFYSTYTNEVEGIPVTAGLILIPTGSFNMGSIGVAEPVHTVNITRDYYLGKYETTQKEWTDIMGSNPSYGYGVGDNYPVYNVSWYSILVYCNKRSISEGFAPCYTISGSTDPSEWGPIPAISNSPPWNNVICNFSTEGYRLPTEAEWEHAARYNDGRTYPWGETAPSNTLCNYNQNVSATTVVGNYPIGNSKLGLCDLAGNVWEWVWDGYDTYPSTTQTDPTGPTTTPNDRVLRGGNFVYSQDSIRCAFRERNEPSGFDKVTNGFRIARTK